MIENFLVMVERFGFVPNGGRVYYERRSQPPFLIPMVKLYLDATNDMDFLRYGPQGLLTRHRWLTHRYPVNFIYISFYLRAYVIRILHR